MIDAVSFATTYNAFWNSSTPTCEHFVRRLNMEGVERFEPPIPKGGGSKHALIAEFAFSLFVESMRKSKPPEKLLADAEVLESAWRETEKRLAPYVIHGVVVTRDISEEEWEEVVAISRATANFFGGSAAGCILRPMFSGCGYIDESEGDIIFDKCIFEVKTVDRPYRSVDLRQVITYAALNFSSHQYDVESVGLFNPRAGTFFKTELDRMCWEISGQPAQELLSMIVETISSGATSR